MAPPLAEVKPPCPGVGLERVSGRPGVTLRVWSSSRRLAHDEKDHAGSDEAAALRSLAILGSEHARLQMRAEAETR